ncbi:MAG: hypothetical protein GY866_02440 [Proteobacteria bacterium]|nr:hypothetical protein [Pseudomonadota bacterium]
MKRKIGFLFLIGLLISIWTSFGTALQAQEKLGIGRSYRALALGNTGVASAIDSAALYYNPAVLANVEGWWFDYAAWTLEASNGFTAGELAPTLVSVNFPYLSTEGVANDQKATFLSKENPYIRGNAGMYISMNLTQEGFAMAGSYLLEFQATTRDDGATIYQRDDIVQKFGMSIPLGMGQFVLGLSANRIYRRVASDATTDTIPNWGSRYSGVGYDVGLLYRMANVGRVTWGLVAQNYGGIEFEGSDLTEPQRIALGISMIHELGIFKVIPAIDIREINAETDKKNTVHAGLEIGMIPNSTGGSYLTWRTGYNQGYISQGVEMNFFNHSMILGYTLYGEEVGEGTDKVESRRAVLYLSLGF